MKKLLTVNFIEYNLYFVATSVCLHFRLFVKLGLLLHKNMKSDENKTLTFFSYFLCFFIFIFLFLFFLFFYFQIFYFSVFLYFSISLFLFLYFYFSIFVLYISIIYISQVISFLFIMGQTSWTYSNVSLYDLLIFVFFIFKK